ARSLIALPGATPRARARPCVIICRIANNAWARPAPARRIRGPLSASKSDQETAFMSSPVYPRDLVGYGRNPPHANWPDGARVAVQFVLNYEEGGENCVLHGDPGSEQFLSEIIGAAAYPDRHLSTESIYEYGSPAGVWRILPQLKRRRLPSPEM